MKRILFPLFLAVLVMSACKRGNLNSDAKPNVIIFLTDDQGWGDLSINGNTNLQTPRIDKLATNGASFDHFYVSPVDRIIATIPVNKHTIKLNKCARNINFW